MTDSPYVIGIAGAVFDIDGHFVCSSNAGKDTVGDQFMAGMSPNLNVERTSFASILIDVVIESYPDLSVTDFTCQSAKNTPRAELGGKTPRDLLIETSARKREEIGPDWLSVTMRQRLAESKADAVIISDVRRPAEAGLCRDLGSVVHVHRRVNQSGSEFLRSIGLAHIDPATEIPLSIIAGKDKLVDNSFEMTGWVSRPGQVMAANKFGVFVYGPDHVAEAPMEWISVRLDDKNYAVMNSRYPGYFPDAIVRTHDAAATVSDCLNVRSQARSVDSAHDARMILAMTPSITESMFNTPCRIRSVDKNNALNADFSQRYNDESELAVCP